MYILKDLWYGNITPFTRTFRADSEYARLMHRCVQQGEKLQRLLSDEAKAHLTDYQQAYNDLTSLSDEESFVIGFRLGARTMLDVFSNEGQFHYDNS